MRFEPVGDRPNRRVARAVRDDQRAKVQTGFDLAFRPTRPDLIHPTLGQAVRPRRDTRV